jgi:hypothetical protein
MEGMCSWQAAAHQLTMEGRRSQETLENEGRCVREGKFCASEAFSCGLKIISCDDGYQPQRSPTYATDDRPGKLGWYAGKMVGELGAVEIEASLNFHAT